MCLNTWFRPTRRSLGQRSVILDGEGRAEGPREWTLGSRKHGIYRIVVLIPELYLLLARL